MGTPRHVSAGVRAGLCRRFSFTVEADFLNIDTSGTHRLQYADSLIDLQWTNGVRVWSSQNSVQMTLAYHF